jgi:hypothetical protein
MRRVVQTRIAVVLITAWSCATESTPHFGQPHAVTDAIARAVMRLSPAWLKIDPTWASLRGNARFERLLSQPAATTGP